MGKLLTLYYIILGVVLGVIYSVITIYNRIIKYRNAADAGFNQIKVAMKKRLDMVEQLLGAVKGYVQHERELFENIAKLRTGVTDADSSGLNTIDKESRQIVSNLLAIAEAYPELKASENVGKLMEAIVDVEDEIARHRYTYNNVVQEYNTMQDTIPSNFVAGAMGSTKLGYLEFEEEINEAPDVSVN
ncbi:MAG: LemA family protein [Candidatus Bathyarchaeota archaeon]|nr:LemA family protein [Candidatus Bathyarchaeota archaeon]